MVFALAASPVQPAQAGAALLQKDRRSGTDAAARFTPRRGTVRPAEMKTLSISNLRHFGRSQPLGGMHASALPDSTNRHQACRAFEECEEEDLGNIKCSYCCQMLRACSWQPGPGARSECACIGNVRLLGPADAHGCVGARNSTSTTHVLFLTFLIKQDNSVTLFLQNQTTIFK